MASPNDLESEYRSRKSEEHSSSAYKDYRRNRSRSPRDKSRREKDRYLHTHSSKHDGRHQDRDKWHKDRDGRYKDRDRRHKAHDGRHKDCDERHHDHDERHKYRDERHHDHDERHKYRDERHHDHIGWSEEYDRRDAARQEDHVKDRNRYHHGDHRGSGPNKSDEGHRYGRQSGRHDNHEPCESGVSRHKQRLRPGQKEEDSQEFQYGQSSSVAEKDKPNFAVSGKLAADTNTYKGVVIKYSEPPEARKPKVKWRLYPFKGEETLPVLHIHRQSAYLIGRDRHIVDIPVDHPSCSKQHAVLQYRFVDFEKANGTMGKATRPYLIDLESTNGTCINNDRIESAKYYQLKEKDVIKFGFSSREYVVLHEQSVTAPPSDDDD